MINREDFYDRLEAVGSLAYDEYRSWIPWHRWMFEFALRKLERIMDS